MAFFEVNDIRKSFGRHEVLKGVSFGMEKGDVLSIIGASGGGKTTLLRCLNLLEIPSQGSISVDGYNIYDADTDQKISAKDLRDRRLHMGLVFQSFNLFPQYNVMDNLTLAPLLKLKEEAKINKMSRADYKEAVEMVKVTAEGLLFRVGLSDKAKAYPCELSGGQMQRVAIARALTLRPDILCFDEPTSALDPELTGEVLRVILELKNTNTTMIVVTHEMDFARSVSDKVIFMADGLIEEEGAPEDVFGNPKSEKMRAFLSHGAESWKN